MFLRRVFQGTFRTPQERLKVAFFFFGLTPKTVNNFISEKHGPKGSVLEKNTAILLKIMAVFRITLKIYRKTSAKPNKLNFGEFLMQKKKEKKRQAQSFIANMF